MARVISVFLPLWPIDRLRRQGGEAAPSPEAPLVLARKGRQLLSPLLLLGELS